jgi:hypothetical protein
MTGTMGGRGCLGGIRILRGLRCSNCPGANRQIIVEVFPTDHRRVLRLMDRQIIVEVGGGSEPSSSWRLRLEPLVLCRNEFGIEAGWRAIAPAISAGISRLARRAGRAGLAWGRLACPREAAKQPPLLHETRAGPG